MKRRTLLHTGVTGLALLPLAGRSSAAAINTGSIRAFSVDNALGVPLIPRGTWILADTAKTTWNGPGLYLYPHWGEPRAYRVTQSLAQETSAGPGLEFRDPASGNLLWTVTQTAETRFAGKICALGCASPALAQLQLEAPSVPRLPQGNPTFL